MRNPILVLLISGEHQIQKVIPTTIMNHLRNLYYPFLSQPYEHYCVVCGRKYTDDWFKLESSYKFKGRFSF
jgi:hypothetical protein